MYVCVFTFVSVLVCVCARACNRVCGGDVRWRRRRTGGSDYSGDGGAEEVRETDPRAAGGLSVS